MGSDLNFCRPLSARQTVASRVTDWAPLDLRSAGRRACIALALSRYGCWAEPKETANEKLASECEAEVDVVIVRGGDVCAVDDFVFGAWHGAICPRQRPARGDGGGPQQSRPCRRHLDRS